VRYDEARSGFVVTDGHAADPPDVMVLQDSPLGYSSTPDPISQIAARDYSLEQSIHAVDPAFPGLAYDRDDAFFVPLAGFDGVTRPGPNFSIYVRRTAMP